MFVCDIIIIGYKVYACYNALMYKDREKQNAFQRLWQKSQREKRKKKVVALLGGKCKRCGYDTNIHALQIDHLELVRRSPQHRGGTSGAELYRKIVNGEISISKVQLLCANCHCIKTNEEDRKNFSNSKT